MQDSEFSPPPFWRVAAVVPAEAVSAVADALGRGAVAVATFEADDEGRTWLVEATWLERPALAAFAGALAVIAAVLGLPEEPALVIEPVRTVDWLAESLASFRPIRAGRFLVRGSHLRGPIPASTQVLEVDAATAFGSGEHESTRGCLLALDHLAKRDRARRVGRGWRSLDMGCGSGILALAIAKAWRRRVLAIDIDEESVRVTRANARRNRVAPQVRAAAGDGYHTSSVRRRGRFDLVAANILARPLARMAGELSRRLDRRHGIAVLAGLLRRQERLVVLAHRRRGLQVRGRIRLGEWTTLILGRSARPLRVMPPAGDCQRLGSPR